MHCISISCVVFLLIVAQRGKLTNDDFYKNQKSTSFTRAGSLGEVQVNRMQKNTKTSELN